MDSEAQSNEKLNLEVTEEGKEDVIDFDGENDPTNPQNWSSLYKYSLVMIISLLSMSANLGILMCVPAVPEILKEFHSSSKVESTLAIMIWELGEVICPLVVAPLCELYGRLPVYHVANILFLIFTIACALSNMLIALRFCVGLTVASTVLNSVIVGDMFPKERRGRALGIMGIIPFTAPILGPIAGGFITQAKGWRWTFWLVAIIVAPLQIAFMALYRETYRVKILEKKASKLRKSESESGSVQHIYHPGKPRNIVLRDTCLRPLKILFVSRLVIMVGVCSALITSLVYTLISSLSIIYDEQYHFRQGFLGLTYLGLGIGMVVGVQVIGRLLDLYLKSATTGVSKPERRLPFLVFGSCAVCLGVLAFGWTVRYHTHWIVPILISTLIGFGYLAATISSTSYILDVFGIHTAAAMGGNLVIRNSAGALLPLAGPALADKLGYGWGYTVLCFMGLIAVPVGLCLIRFGEPLRAADRSVAEAHGGN